MPASCSSSNFGSSMFPQSNGEAYIGKHGATVPFVRTTTLFCPARQFHSAKCRSPEESCTMPGMCVSCFAVPWPLSSPFHVQEDHITVDVLSSHQTLEMWLDWNQSFGKAGFLVPGVDRHIEDRCPGICETIGNIRP